MAGSALLNSLRELLLGVNERVRHDLRPTQERPRGSRWIGDADRGRQVERPGGLLSRRGYGIWKV